MRENDIPPKMQFNGRGELLFESSSNYFSLILVLSISLNGAVPE